MDPISLAIGGYVAYSVLKALTRRFTYRKVDGEWRAYFNGKPPSLTHLYKDNRGYYICWDRPVRSKSEMQAIAQKWMELWG